MKTTTTLLLAGLGLALASPALAGQTSRSSSGAAAQAIAIGGEGGGGGGGSASYTYVNPPAVFGGTNPCEVGASGGVGVNGVGVSLGFSHSDRECSLRQWYVLMMQSEKATGNPAYAAWARGIACSADSALRAVAPPGMCGGNATPPQTRPASIPAMPIVQQKVLPTPPDWCFTASPGERRRFPVCRGVK